MHVALLVCTDPCGTIKQRKDDSEVVAKLTELAEKLPTRGFDVYYNRIRTEGLVWNRKRVLRVYRGYEVRHAQKAQKACSHAHTTAVRDTRWPERGMEHGLYE